MGENLVVVTYPYHYHVTQLAIIHALKLYNIQNVYVFYDHIDKPIEIGRTLQDDLAAHNISVIPIPFASIKSTRSQSNGWIRQQYVKLHLHQVLNDESWLVLDGDSILQTKLDPNTFCYFNAHDDRPDHHKFFTNYTLDLNFKDITFCDKIVSFSAVPFRKIKRHTLIQLEKHICKLHGKTIDELYDSFTLPNKSTYLEISEFELINNFEFQILQEPLNLKPANVGILNPADFITSWNDGYDILALQGHDHLPINWYANNGISINEKIWNQLYSK